jgi:uncharacterized RDD family membrane protein YckC
MNQSIQRDGMWWHQQPDGAWLRWNGSRQNWEPAHAAPPPPSPPPAAGGFGHQPGSALSSPAPYAVTRPVQAWQPIHRPLQIASTGRRIGAALIDLLCVGIINFMVGFVGAFLLFATGGTVTDQAASLLNLVGIVVFSAYYVATEAILGGTPAKLMLGLRVVKEDGSAISWGGSLVRNLLRLVDYVFFFLPGLISMSSSPRDQRIGDRAAGTVVVHRGSA